MIRWGIFDRNDANSYPGHKAIGGKLYMHKARADREADKMTAAGRQVIVIMVQL